MDNNKEIIVKSTNTDEIIIAINNLISEANYDQELIAQFVKFLNSDDRGLRDAAYRILIHYPDNLKSKVAEKVAPMIENRAIEYRNLAGDILLKLGLPSALSLVKYLKVDDFDIRKFACDIIGLIDDGTLLDTVMQLYDDTDTNVVLSAIEAVGNIFYNNQTNIDKTHIIESLVELFETGNEVVKPQIVEALGKIGGKEAEKFLLNVLRYESDFFVKIAAIDSLAIVGSDLDICTMLLDEIHTYPYNIQTVVLKTAIAIGYRIGVQATLPIEGRDIARRALIDIDSDISSAGLVALGESYEVADIENLVVFYEKSDFETQQYLLYNLIQNSEVNAINEFLRLYFDIHNKKEFTSANVDLVSTIQSIWQNISENKGIIVITLLCELIMINESTNKNELLELISKFSESELTIVKLQLSNNAPELSEAIEELFKQIYIFK
ncbi:MAG TPA: HEAT repeat domain-containing protein [Candidatus Kapabacteria bacterium]|nr:HEAT repeat domain-containing protein [Candidatus Kapabacteria bacterium]